ncbi:MAG: hypothetical protein LKI21_07555 [Bifidobacterium crudilactis]|jgi:hypothetical protein|nr:hypothetical protein [Bifidobacterium crudilactis]
MSVGVVDDGGKAAGGADAGGFTGLLPVFAAPATGRVWLVAAHGGAGCTTIYRSNLEGYADAGRALPVCDTRASRLVLCAMATGRGLESLQGLLAEYERGLFGSSVLVGVAVSLPVARLPRELKRAVRLVASASPACWVLPYVPGLVLDGFPSRYPAVYRRMAEQSAESQGRPI